MPLLYIGAIETRSFACPSCQQRHLLIVGEINARRRVEVGCSGCGSQIAMEFDETTLVVGR
jgi:transcription elongation factor Elf1